MQNIIVDFKVKVKHDNGTFTITVKNAGTAENAKQLVMKAENCPASAIVNIKEIKIKPLPL